ncbi:MAG: BadF/BadG/BcrA/BcrD ATPase family protein [Lachnospiraceae bacterium]|nr:BadF/BadG/BcrA/BcrD ATPase family protein [Lachnospiraceae bacterium]
MKYYVVVDGGGTKTDFMISTPEKKELFGVRTGSTSIKSVGFEIAQNNMHAGFEKIKSRLDFHKEDVLFCIFGISGCDSKEDELQIKNIIENIDWNVKKEYYLCNDAVLAFYAKVERPGMILISGTGSIVIGIDEKGMITRTGGWGYGISDQGSGQWLGMEAIRHTLLYCDGCIPYEDWFDKVRKTVGAENFEDVPGIVTSYDSYDQIAALAKILLDEAEGKLRNRILDEGAKALALLLNSNYKKMHIQNKEKLKIGFAGGCLRNNEYANAVKNYLIEQIKEAVMQDGDEIPICTPVEGGRKLIEIMYGPESR